MIARADQYRNLLDKLIVDLFAGAGGASTGIEEGFTSAGLQRAVDIAINHDPDAVSCHELNHPLTQHLRADVFEVDPESIEGEIGLLWASPDCTDFSKAKGGKPIRDIKRRSLAWVVVHWAFVKRPDVIILENVEEFQQWGLIDDHGQPIRDGRCFAAWVSSMRSLGYDVQWSELRACDYGTPTTRKRLFIIARCDGKPIIWPEKTHGEVQGTNQHQRRRISRSVDGDGRSVRKDEGWPLADRREGNNRHGWVEVDRGNRNGRSDRTLIPYRTAAECIDWSIPMLSIFATPAEAKAWGKLHGIPTPRRPLADNTLRRIARGIVRYVLEAPGGMPFIVPYQSERPGQTPRTHDIDAPMPTVAAGGTPALVSALITKHYGGVTGHPIDRPIGTVTTTDHHALTTAILTHAQQGGSSRDLQRPMHTVTASAKDQNQVAAAHLVKLKGTCRDGQPVDRPISTIQAGGTHSGLVAAFLQKYYREGSRDQSLSDPMHTIPTVDRYGLVTVNIDDQTYVVTDIAMRMLTPRELARAQGFRDDYVIDRGSDGRKLSKRTQVRLIGNSVCRHVARALVRSNVINVCDWATPTPGSGSGYRRRSQPLLPTA